MEKRITLTREDFRDQAMEVAAELTSALSDNEKGSPALTLLHTLISAKFACALERKLFGAPDETAEPATETDH